MEESSGKPAVSKRSKYFSSVKSSYSLRKRLARSDSKPKPKTNFSEISSSSNLGPSNFSNAAKSQANETPKSLPRKYPSLVRVSAVQNLPSSSPKTPLKHIDTKKEEVHQDGGGEGEVHQESESRKRVTQTLQGFREIYDKIREGEKQLSGSRCDLVAYNLFKEMHKDLSGANRRLGAVPGVEIGDAFEFRLELLLVGLHCHPQASIDYAAEDNRLVACSIVFTIHGKRSNNVLMSGDVLVCRGSGKGKKTQKMEGGNLALKNCIDDGNPVRVILGLGGVKRIKYVYAGLYSVEKYWCENDHHGINVFSFQLKRLEGQTELNIEEVKKSISSRTRSRDGDDIDLLPSKCTSIVRSPDCFGKRGGMEEEQSLAKEAESRKRLKQTLHEFILTYERLAEEDDAKQKKVLKKEAGKRSIFHLDAYNLCKVQNKDLSQVTSRLGAVPGVEVGDKFHLRVELSLLGLHCRLRSDIDYIRKDKMLLAVSIVSVRLRQYNADVHKSDVLLFRASGLKNVHPQIATKTMALKNSIDAKTPVRVFYGFRKNSVITLYVYCGLYLVEKHLRKKNNDGRYDRMFQLRRLPGQAKIDVKEAMGLMSLRSKPGHRYTEDISRGKEKLPIRVVNTIDDERLKPFEYVTEVIYPSNYSPAPLEGCICVDGCSDSDTCACAVRNGGDIPFNSEGAIVEAKPLVYACGPSCKCPPSCHNRVSRHGIKFPLEIFKTETMGWGVRCRAFIPSGSFICEYIGELLEDEEAQKRTTDEYLFAIGNNYYDESLWEGLSSVPCLQKSASSEAEKDGGFTADASRYGNIAKFINHSCTPNLYAQNLLYDHDDKRMPHIMFYACEDIPPLQELTYHYNYTVDDVQDSEGNIRKKNCYCGSIECSGRLY